MKDESMASLKELLPQMGPRVRLIKCLKDEYPSHPPGKMTPGENNSNKESRLNVLGNLYKGQQIINLTTDGGWSLQKMEARVT